jgi:2'-5' RNA ligase
MFPSRCKLAFLGIRVPAEVGRLITGLEVPGEKESPSEYHITILCFDDNWPISAISKALEATYDVVSKFNPFRVTSEKISHFPPFEDNPIPIIAPIESKELHKLRDKLVEAFEEDDIDFKKNFPDFKPHITLAYSKDEHDDSAIDPAIEFTVSEIVLWGGDHGDDRIFITFPLKGPERCKHSMLVQKATVFEKLAKSPVVQDHLTPTYERRKEER